MVLLLQVLPPVETIEWEDRTPYFVTLVGAIDFLYIL